MTEHEIKYEGLSQKYGVRWTEDSPQLVGETLETLMNKYKKDVHLNNVPLRRWDILAYQMRVPIRHYEKVCLAKYAAIKMLKSIMEENNDQETKA